MWIKFSQGVGIHLGKPDLAMGIKCYVVWRTGQGQRLAWIAGIRHCERGQVVDLVLSCVGKVVSNVVGVLFGKPDASLVVDSRPHHATIALRQWVFTKIPRCCDRRKGC